MKKHNLAEFFKSKSFYALLCVGALAIIAITMVGLNRTSDKEQNKNLVDLNEPIADVSEGEDISNQEIVAPDTNNTTSTADANNKTGTSQAEVSKSNPDNQVSEGGTHQAVTDGSLLEYDVFDDPSNVKANDTAEGSKTQKADKPKETKPEQKEETQAVMKPETLHFKAETGLLWPVNGNVLMNYSADRVIYFQTLEQFKCNPAIIIDAKVGTEVLSAAAGIITSIEDVDETGLTVTTSIGSGYSLVYGQLKDVKFKVGDTVKEGQVVGTVAKPSKYYSVEGSNLYFQVVKEDSTVDPMLLLR